VSTTPTPPSTPPVPVAPAGSLADTILSTLDALLTAASGIIPFAGYADLLLKIAQKGVQSYEAHVGAPIDVTLLKPIDKV
jgi:hypothetical protein